MEAVLAEAGCLAGVFNARLLLIHMGKKTLKLAAHLDEIHVRSGGRLQNTTTVWLEDRHVDSLLHICKENAVDLLILDTVRREGILRYFLGSLVRDVCRTAKCSLLLLTEPKVVGTAFNKIIVRGVVNPKTPLTLSTALYFAQQVGVGEITMVTELDQPGLSMATAFTGSAASTDILKKQITNGEVRKIQDMVRHCRSEEVKVIEEIISGRQGYAIRQLTKNQNADLLVINSPDSRYGFIDRIFTHDMEYILEDLPSNVLIVHSRIS